MFFIKVSSLGNLSIDGQSVRCTLFELVSFVYISSETRGSKGDNAFVTFNKTVYKVSYAFFESLSSACFQNLGLLRLIYQLFIASIKPGTDWQAPEIS